MLARKLNKRRALRRSGRRRKRADRSTADPRLRRQDYISYQRKRGESADEARGHKQEYFRHGFRDAALRPAAGAAADRPGLRLA